MQSFYLWRNVQSTAPSFTLWWWKLEILFDPFHQIFLHRGQRCKLFLIGHRLHIRGRGGGRSNSFSMSMAPPIYYMPPAKLLRLHLLLRLGRKCFLVQEHFKKSCVNAAIFAKFHKISSYLQRCLRKSLRTSRLFSNFELDFKTNNSAYTDFDIILKTVQKMCVT
jgi:hypothetical protein